MTICKVCGTGFEQDSILCAQCETPHHTDCFLYSRGCSVYACGSLKYKAALYNDIGKFIGLETKDVATLSLTDIMTKIEIPHDHASLVLTYFLRGYNVYRILHQQPHVLAVDSATDTLNITDNLTRAICRWAAVEWRKILPDDFFIGPEEKKQFTAIVKKYANELRKHTPNKDN